MTYLAAKRLLFQLAKEASPSLLDMPAIYRKALDATDPEQGGDGELHELVRNAGRRLGIAP